MIPFFSLQLTSHSTHTYIRKGANWYNGSCTIIMDSNMLPYNLENGSFYHHHSQRVSQSVSLLEVSFFPFLFFCVHPQDMAYSSNSSQSVSVHEELQKCLFPSVLLPLTLSLVCSFIVHVLCAYRQEAHEQISNQVGEKCEHTYHHHSC